jgi:Glycosyl transferase 4-like domain
MHRVTIISAVYPPEPVVSAQIARDLAGRLAQDGARVTVLCPLPSRPIGADYAEFRPTGAPRMDCENGVEVVRLPSFLSPQSKLLSRMRESLSFGKHVCRYLEQHLSDVDVVYANTWPLFSPALIARHCARRGIPLVLHITDVYPESLLAKLPLLAALCVKIPFPTVDGTFAVTALHQFHDYAHMRGGVMAVHRGSDAIHNLKQAGGPRSAVMISDTEYVLKGSIVSRWPCRGDRLRNLELKLRHESGWLKTALALRLIWRGLHAVGIAHVRQPTLSEVIHSYVRLQKRCR